MSEIFDKDKYDKEDRAFLASYGRWPSVSEKEQFVKNRMGFFKVYNEFGVGVNRAKRKKTK